MKIKSLQKGLHQKTRYVSSGLRGTFAILSFVLFFASARAATPLEIDITISNAVNTQFSFATGANDNKPGGVVGVALDGEFIFQRAYGMADVAGGVPNSTSAPFYLASVSKQFTATSILLCQEKGLLTTSDELRLHIPELHTNFNGVTIQHMLNMISAIYDTGTGNKTNNANAMLTSLMDETGAGIVTNQLPIGSVMDYCNMNYVLLGIIVEHVSGKTLRQFVQDEIFTKLGMTGADIRDRLDQVITNQPNGYSPDLVTVWSTASSNSPATGSTGVTATLADLLKWHENFYSNRLGATNQSLITTLETKGVYTSGPTSGQPVRELILGLPSYACGVMPDTYGGNARVWHGGRWVGFKSIACRYPNLHMSVFIMVNRDDQLPDFQIIADIFLTTVRFANTPPPSSIQQGVPFSFKYTATGAPRPVFSLESGSLPEGLMLSTNGMLTGTPTVKGDFSGSVKATSGAKTNSQAFAIHVDPPPVIEAYRHGVFMTFE